MSFGRNIERVVPGLAITTDDEVNIGTAPAAGTVTSVIYIPDAAMAAGDGTDHRIFSLINKGTDGAGTTVIATATTNGNAFAADVDEVITLSATAADLVVAEDDVLAWKSDAVGAGVVDPGGVVRVEFSPTVA